MAKKKSRSKKRISSYRVNQQKNTRKNKRITTRYTKWNTVLDKKHSLAYKYTQSRPERRYIRPDLIIINKLRRRFNARENIKQKLSYIPNRLMALERFTSPRKLLVCAGRKIRREVLFANRRVGKGKRVKNRRIYTRDSEIRC